MKNAPTHYLYVLIDPRDERVFYVGISINPKKRLTQHCRVNNRAYKTNPLKAKLIRKLSKLGLKPRMEIVDELPESMIAQAERDWIAYLGRFFELVNISPGGDSKSEETRNKIRNANLGKVYSEESRKKRSEVTKAHWAANESRRVFSDDHRRKIAEAQFQISEETRKKKSEAAKGKVLPEGQKRKISEGLKIYWASKKAA